MKQYGVLFSLIMVGSLAAMEGGDEEASSLRATSPIQEITGSFRHPDKAWCWNMHQEYASRREAFKRIFDANRVAEIERINDSRENSPAGSPSEECAFEHGKTPNDTSSLPVIAQHALILAQLFEKQE